MRATDNFATMRKTLASAVETIDELEARFKTLDAERMALEELPMNDASPYWHQDKYLYLIHRTKDGYRPRKYIGKVPEKIKGALDSIERFQEHQKICAEQQAIRTRLMDAQFLVQQFLNRINGRGR